MNPVPELAQLEAEIMEEANRWAWARWASAGKVSLIGCKIGAANRLPASFFVSVAYDCWAFRRLGVRLDASSGAITRWLYRDPNRAVERMARSGGLPADRPRSGADRAALRGQVRALQVGDVVLITGEVFTGRDAVHAYLMKNAPPVDLRGAVLYHCGPVMLKAGRRVDGEGRRTDHQQPRRAVSGDVIEKYGVRAVIGKGGMGQRRWRR